MHLAEVWRDTHWINVICVGNNGYRLVRNEPAINLDLIVPNAFKLTDRIVLLLAIEDEIQNSNIFNQFKVWNLVFLYDFLFSELLIELSDHCKEFLHFHIDRDDCIH